MLAEGFAIVRRQSQPPTNEAAMTDKDGNIVAFDPAGVVLANRAAGL